MNLELNVEEAKEIKGVFILTPQVSDDLRGNIWTSFIKQEVEKLIPENLEFNHDKFSLSKNNVLRGIHGDSKSWKLVTCVYGKIQQVVVDMRKDSPTYLNWIDFEISRKNQQLVLIPPNMGNAYYVMSKEAVYHYKLAYHGSYIDADEQFSVKWDNEEININWSTDSPILSLRDSS